MTGLEFWTLQVPGWLLVAYLVVAQCVSALNYDLGVKMGTQEPADRITDVGVAMFWGYAFADLIFYVPVLVLGLIGHALGTGWSVPVLAAALGITAYWPLVCLSTVARARGAAGWNLPKESQYWIVLPIIAAWGLWGLILLVI